MCDADSDSSHGLGMVLAFGHHSALDPIGRHAIETHGQHQAGGVDDLDLLPHPGAQRACEVAGVVAEDDCPRTVALNKKGWQ